MFLIGSCDDIPCPYHTIYLQLAIDSITNIRTVASLHKEQYFADEYSAALLKPHLEALKKSHLRGTGITL